jgi:hypothetical protein
MSMFICARCAQLADGDDGCAEWGRQLVCADCMTELDDEQEDARDE